jgi:GNAT superfamily N-acetyltransferase
MTGEDIEPTASVVLAGGWADLRSYLRFYVTHPACQPFVAESDGQIIGTATGTVSGSVGWLAHIFTAPEYRGRGIGTALTQTVMADLEGKGCRTLLLGASEMGWPIYEKLGFRVVSTYHYLDGPYRPDPVLSERLQPLRPADLPELCAFDRQVTGEDRSHLWQAFQETGWVTRDEHTGEMTGYAVVTPWETGPVIARSAQDARLLLEQVSRAADDEQVFAALLSENAAGLAALEQAGFTIRRRVPRMLKGEPITWEPTLIWRIFGLALG